MKRISFNALRGLNRARLYAALTGVAILAVFSSSLGEQIKVRVQQPIEFQLRHLLGFDPKISDEIKIYSFGDKALSAIGKTDIPLSIWSRILEGLSKAGAEYIFIDKLFGTPGSDAEVKAFGEKIKDLKAKVIVGAFVTKQNLQNKDQIEFPETSLISESSRSFKFSEKFFAYGAPKILQPYFKYYGHLNYDNDNHSRLTYPVSSTKSIATAALLTQDSLNTENGQLSLNGRKLRTASNNRMLINLGAKSSYSSRNYSFKSLYFRARDKVPMKLKPKEKYVVIMLESYTGGTDFVDTAHGTMPGGFTHVAILNSILTNQWLSVLPFTSLFIFLFATLGFLFATRLNAKRFLLSAILLPTATFIIGVFLFIFAAIQTPWLGCCFSFAIVGGIVFLEKSRLAEIASLLLKKDLELGRSAQALFLPDHSKGEIGSFKFSIKFKPYGPLSGDWVQTYFKENRSAIAIGDVVGKGPSAALNTSVIAAVWSQHCEKWDLERQINIYDLITDLNKTIYKLFKGKQFTTFSCIVCQNEKLLVYNVGAPPWLTLNPQEGCKSVRLPSKNPLGIEKEFSKFAEKSVDLGSNSILVAYTDGAMDGTASRRILNSTFRKREEAMTHEDCNELILHAGEEERLPDDYTVLMISRLAEQEIDDAA